MVLLALPGSRTCEVKNFSFESQIGAARGNKTLFSSCQGPAKLFSQLQVARSELGILGQEPRNKLTLSLRWWMIAAEDLLMQTFVPYEHFAQCARVLDRQRLGKQRVETLQIVQALVPVTGRRNHGWRNHPATKMWQNNLDGLIAYGVAICDEWIGRGYKDTCKEKLLAVSSPDFNDLPAWWGDSRVHLSHQSNLLRKDRVFYGQWDWLVEDDLPYFWPVA